MEFVCEKGCHAFNACSLAIHATNEDLQRFLDSNLSRIPSFIRDTAGIEDKIKGAIIDAADGMYV